MISALAVPACTYTTIHGREMSTLRKIFGVSSERRYEKLERSMTVQAGASVRVQPSPASLLLPFHSVDPTPKPLRVRPRCRDGACPWSTPKTFACSAWVRETRECLLGCDRLARALTGRPRLAQRLRGVVASVVKGHQTQDTRW